MAVHVVAQNNQYGKTSSLKKSRRSQLLLNITDLSKSRVSRVLMVVELLKIGFTLTSDEMVRVFGISRRTAYRDMRELENMGIPVIRNEGNYSIDADKSAARSTSLSQAWIRELPNSR